MKLGEALAVAKVALESDCHPYTECMDTVEPCHDRMHRGLDDLIAAVEEEMSARRHEADLERENAALRLEMKTMADHQVVLMDALDAVKNSTHAMRRAQ